MIYLACPHTHKDPFVQHMRWVISCYEQMELLRQGIPVFNPIGCTHLLASKIHNLSHEGWLRLDRRILIYCSEMLVLKIEGWDKSEGIKQEIEFTKEHGILREFLVATATPRRMIDAYTHFMKWGTEIPSTVRKDFESFGTYKEPEA